MNPLQPSERSSDASKKLDVQSRLKEAFEENKRKREAYKAKLYQTSPTLQSAYKALADSGIKVPEFASAERTKQAPQNSGENLSTAKPEKLIEDSVKETVPVTQPESNSRILTLNETNEEISAPELDGHLNLSDSDVATTTAQTSFTSNSIDNDFESLEPQASLFIEEPASSPHKNSKEDQEEAPSVSLATSEPENGTTTIIFQMGAGKNELAEKLNRIRSRASRVASNVEALNRKKIEKIGK